MTASTKKPSPPHLLLRWVHSVLFYDHWMIGIIDEPIANALRWTTLPPVRWIAPFDKKRYFADPFPWPGSADTILCETFDIARRTGRITALKLDDNGIAVELPIDLPVAGHLSFPFLFMRDGVVYAMPESSAAGKLEIFRWHEKFGQWVSHAVVFDDRQAADATLFEKNGLFWISYTDIAPQGGQGPHDNLHLIYASSLAGPWLRHPRNPVRTGRGSSRNGGGVFEVEGKLYRPAQDCTQHYGGALRIMEITSWTTNDYQEKEVTRILPDTRLYRDGVHTLTAWGDRCLIDGMRVSFSGKLVWNKIVRRLFPRILHNR